MMGIMKASWVDLDPVYDRVRFVPGASVWVTAYSALSALVYSALSALVYSALSALVFPSLF